MPINCVVIDDEPLARECITNYVREVDFLELTGIGSNPVELERTLNEQSVDLIFLDIQMPLLNGVDYLRMTPLRPMVILTTAYPHYALEGFQLDVLDYLVKPITFDRFFKSVTKARDYHRLKTLPLTGESDSRQETADYFFIKCDYTYERINCRDIIYVEAVQNYITLHTSQRKYMTLLSLKHVEEKLDPLSFIRVHKSYLVATAQIQSIENNELVLSIARIPVSRTYRDEVMKRVLNGKLWKK